MFCVIKDGSTYICVCLSTYHRHSFRTQDWVATIRKGRCQHLVYLQHDLGEGDGEENDDKDLEEGEHDEVLHPDADVDD